MITRDAILARIVELQDAIIDYKKITPAGPPPDYAIGALQELKTLHRIDDLDVRLYRRKITREGLPVAPITLTKEQGEVLWHG